jgi:N-acetyltransferase 10
VDGRVFERCVCLIITELSQNGGIDFRRRFLSLLSFKFREFGSVTALSVLEAADIGVKKLDGEKLRGKVIYKTFLGFVDTTF